MFQIDTDTAVAVRPAPAAAGVVGWFTGGNPGPGTPVPATNFSPDWCNIIQGEMLSILTAMGIAPDKTKIDQVVTAIKGLIQLGAGTYYPDTGAANALVITPAPAIAAYAGGQRFLVIPANANTGAATINVNALGVKSIVHPDGSALVAGDIPAAGLIEIAYQATLGKFILITVTNNVTLNQFTQSLAAPGWAKLPNGLILQWTTFSISPTNTNNTPPNTKWGGPQSVSWPIAFPHAIFTAQAVNQITTNGNFKLCVVQPSTSFCDVYSTCWDDPLVGLPMTGFMFGVGW
jgi:hypothetical protein